MVTNDRSTVLVVDDDPIILRFMARMLSESFAVTTAPSALDALARIRIGERFDLILSDYTMPVMSGVGLHAAVLEIDSAQARRFAFITASAREGLVEGIRQLTKPVSLAALIAFAQECIASARDWHGHRPTEVSS